VRLTASGFVHEGLAQRVVFGAGASGRVGELVADLGGRRVLLVATPGAERRGTATALRSALGDAWVGTFAGAAMHTPVAVTATAVAEAQALRADCTVAVGGGSAVGLGKAIAARIGSVQVAVPTTYSGSEATPVLGEVRDGRKRTRRAPELLPSVVVYDPDLTLNLPASVTGTSGLNAIAHAVEALYDPSASPVVRLHAEEGLRAMAAALPALAASPRDGGARADALYGAWLCGTSLAGARMGLHHQLCHVLGGTFDLPHAATHAALLPHVLAFNAAAAPDAAARIAAALGTYDAPGALRRLAETVDAPATLGDLGLPAEGIDRVVELVLEAPYPNPRPVTADALRELLADAHHGHEPRAARGGEVRS
jgi:maleylacetate reductase